MDGYRPCYIQIQSIYKTLPKSTGADTELTLGGTNFRKIFSTKVKC